MMRQADPSCAAAAHAEALAHSVAELLRYSREGPSTDKYPFGLDDVSVIMAEALLFTLRIEVQALVGHDEDPAEREIGSQLCAALASWLTDATGNPPED